MSLEAIIAQNLEAAAVAAQGRREPYVPDGVEEVDRYPPFPFPNLGSHVPPGWELTEDSWFVDKSGKGKDWEPALSVSQFRSEIRHHVGENPGHGYAITEEGPFQAVVSAFRRTREAVAETMQGNSQEPHSATNTPETDDENTRWFRNHYECPSCEHQWTDDWTATCDDDCPNCGARHISPHTSDDLEDRP